MARKSHIEFTAARKLIHHLSDKLNIGMLYKELANHHIKVPAKGQIEITVTDSSVLVPLQSNRLFLNWLNDKGNVISTHSLKYSTLVTKSVRIINPEPQEALVLQIDIPAQNI